MKVLIIEDELHAANVLERLIKDVEPSCEVLEVIDSVKGALNWFQAYKGSLDIVFMDIELSDGHSFEIFNHTSIDATIVFTTAYDQYALDAFRVNAVHYLLKPIERSGLEEVFSRAKVDEGPGSELHAKLEEVRSLFTATKKNRCLVKKGGSFEFVNVPDIAFAYSEQSVTFLVTFDGQRHMYSRTIEQLSEELDRSKFFQINRAQLVNVENVLQVHPYLGQRLKLSCREHAKVDELLVSRQRASEFKEWLDR